MLHQSAIQVHSIETLGTHDGPGLRTVIFLQGCKLKCRYCHNPDTIPTEGGESYTAEALFEIIRRNKAYYGKEGGVTFSGGEPLLQAKNLLPLFKMLQADGIHIALDTNGRLQNHFTDQLLDSTDLVMLDIKHMTEEGYQHITQRKNVQTGLDFALHRERAAKPMWLRFVLIPGLTDQKDLLQKLGQHFKDYQSIERLEIQPYHKLGVHKWDALGWEYLLKGQRTNRPEEIQQAVDILSPYFKQVLVN